MWDDGYRYPDFDDMAGGGGYIDWLDDYAFLTPELVAAAPPVMPPPPPSPPPQSCHAVRAAAVRQWALKAAMRTSLPALPMRNVVVFVNENHDHDHHDDDHDDTCFIWEGPSEQATTTTTTTTTIDSPCIDSIPAAAAPCIVDGDDGDFRAIDALIDNIVGAMGRSAAADDFADDYDDTFVNDFFESGNKEPAAAAYEEPTVAAAAATSIPTVVSAFPDPTADDALRQLARNWRASIALTAQRCKVMNIDPHIVVDVAARVRFTTPDHAYRLETPESPLPTGRLMTGVTCLGRGVPNAYREDDRVAMTLLVHHLIEPMVLAYDNLAPTTLAGAGRLDAVLRAILGGGDTAVIPVDEESAVTDLQGAIGAAMLFFAQHIVTVATTTTTTMPQHSHTIASVVHAIETGAEIRPRQYYAATAGYDIQYCFKLFQDDIAVPTVGAGWLTTTDRLWNMLARYLDMDTWDVAAVSGAGGSRKRVVTGQPRMPNRRVYVYTRRESCGTHHFLNLGPRRVSRYTCVVETPKRKAGETDVASGDDERNNDDDDPATAELKEEFTEKGEIAKEKANERARGYVANRPRMRKGPYKPRKLRAVRLFKLRL